MSDADADLLVRRLRAAGRRRGTMSTARADRARGLASRTRGAWRRPTPEQRLAAIAALALLASMLLPWYHETGNAIVDGRLAAIEDSKNAFQVYSFVEAAIFPVAAGVLVLMFARGERRAFHLPGGDGTVVLAAGLWVMFLIFYRQLDKPDGRQEGPINTWSAWWGHLHRLPARRAAGLRRLPHPRRPRARAGPRRRRAPASREPSAPPEPPTRPMRRTPAEASEPPTTVAGQLSFDEEPEPELRPSPPPGPGLAAREPTEPGDVPEYHPPPRRRHPG